MDWNNGQQYVFDETIDNHNPHNHPGHPGFRIRRCQGSSRAKVRTDRLSQPSSD